jgi:hypothetical protein
MKVETIKNALEFKKAYTNLIKFMLDRDFLITVLADGSEELIKSNDYKSIKDSVESMDETEIIIYEKNGRRIGWALIIPYNGDEDSVSDWTISPTMDLWDNEYQKLINELEVA